jgi:hypothetical protein
MVRLLDDAGLRSRLAQGGLESVQRHHTFDAYVNALLTTAQSVADHDDILRRG